jgi:aerobic carbon-monoxide dehydrogenase medium subunit
VVKGWEGAGYDSVKPAPFEYRRPETLDEALEMFAELGSDAKALAGGQSLVPAMNFRLARPTVLVDLNRLDPLAYIHGPPDGGLRIGAMTRQRAAERSPAVADRASLLFEAMPWIAHPQIRNRGTMGGSLAHADPAAELPAVMVALDARFVLRNRTASRTVPAQSFYTGILSTVLGPDELLTEIQIPARAAHSGTAFMELARRQGDFALVGVAVEVVLNQGGDCSSARIVLLSVGDGPVLATGAMAALVGSVPTASRIEEAARVAGETDVDPPSDIHASSAYRRQLARVLVRRAVTRAYERAGRER